ncbi:MAG: hypothetical protein DWI27_03095 [Planctomycetota bacterium]|nr:MAG: hypothetical protein DWI27_03095 [Planctomycetota bacterium]
MVKLRFADDRLEPREIRLRKPADTDQATVVADSRPDIGNRPDQRVVNRTHAVELQYHAVGTMLPDHTPKPLGERAAVTGTSRRLGNFDSQKKPLRPALHSDPPSVPGRMAGIRKRGSLLSNWLSPHRVIMR